jgi:hypothetical protein
LFVHSPEGTHPTAHGTDLAIPTDPVPWLGESRGGEIDHGTFLAEEGIRLVYEDSQMSCSAKGFELVMVPKRGDAVLSQNPGAITPQLPGTLSSALVLGIFTTSIV